MRRTAWGVVASVILVGVLFVAVFPSRTYLAQKRSIALAERRVSVLSIQNEKLAARVQRLDTDAEIERLAREQYNLVRPGEEAYAILPSRPAPRRENRRLPEPEDKGLLSRVWDGVTFWSQ
ncbi:MAG TPA: septum formation initiator family protein [Acidimicrobiales bacterium]|nr:septum formation initiator family protein [Acidimicrobiales bacterium]